MNKTDRFFNSKWGIFNHLFFALQLTPEEQKTKTITEFVDGIDTDLIAKQVHEMGAGYYFVSIFQANQYMNAPNETFDTITGYKPGEACSKTDLIEKSTCNSKCFFLAGMAGFEPADAGVKVPCLTPWLHPNINF